METEREPIPEGKPEWANPSLEAQIADQVTNQIGISSSGAKAITRENEQLQELLDYFGNSMEVTKEGVFLCPQNFPDAEAGRRMLDRLFLNDTRPWLLTRDENPIFVISGISWKAVSDVLYSDRYKKLPDDDERKLTDDDKEKLPDADETLQKVRIGDSIKTFPVERKGLYRKVQLLRDRDQVVSEARYLFEPVWIERLVQKEGGQEGEMVETFEEAPLDIDEFVVHMWRSEVRFWLDIPAINNAINRKDKKAIPVSVAKAQPPVPWKDADIAEVKDWLKKNRAPKKTTYGMYELARFSVDFPQVDVGEKILRKVNCELGKNGWDVTGNVLLPEVPKDINLADYCGPWTEVVTEGNVEYLVATLKGHLDTEGKFTVTKNIVHKSDVSAKLTGDLSLKTEFETSGDVQEWRTIESTTSVKCGNVFWSVKSIGGNIEVVQSCVGWMLETKMGDVHVGKILSNGTVIAPEWTVIIEWNVESSRILAKKVIVRGKLINSLVIGGSVEINEQLSSQVVAKELNVGRLADRGSTENILIMNLPDVESERSMIAEAKAKISDREIRFGTLESKIQAILNDIPNIEDLAKLWVEKLSKLKAEQLKLLAPNQLAAYEKILALVPKMGEYFGAKKELAAMLSEGGKAVAQLTQEIADLEAAIASKEATIGMHIGLVAWHVRAIKKHIDDNSVKVAMEKKGLLPILQQWGGEEIRVNEGEFSWSLREVKSE